MQKEIEVDIDIINGADGDGGVPHGQLLIAFVDAALSRDEPRMEAIRAKLTDTIGEAGLVDAAAVMAMFQLNTRAADASGIPVEPQTAEAREIMGVQLGFDKKGSQKA